MLPEQNVDHVVVELGFDRIRDLLDAMRDAKIIPATIPSTGGWGEHRQPIPRFDLDLVIRYRIALDPPLFDVYHDAQAPGGNVIRLGILLRQGAVSLAAVERSTSRELSRFEYAISGRAAIYGSLEMDLVTKAVFFVIPKAPEFFLDDQSDRVPPVLPKADLEKLLSRASNREIRARTGSGATLPQLRFPITPKVKEIAGMPATFGYAFRDIEQVPDPFYPPICLPPGFGNPSCDPHAPAPSIDRYANLDVFARIQTAQEPVPINRVDRQFQVDIGRNPIARQIGKDNGWGDWEVVAAKLFRYRVGQWIVWSGWPGGGPDDAGIRADVRASLQIAYPRIKMCDGWTKLPWGGRVRYKYPCGIELAYHPVKDTHVWVTVRLKTSGNQLCIERSDVGVEGQTNIIGFIILLVYQGVIVGLLGMFSQLLANMAAAIFFLLNFILLALEVIIAMLARIIPDQVCLDIAEFLKVPVIEDRVQVQLARPLLEMKRTGVTIAIDGDFQRVAP